MKAILLALLCMTLLPSCKKPEGKWEALEDVRVFKEADEADELKFIVEKGGICELGGERVVKSFMYREIACNQGTGWIAYEGGYPFRKMD